MIVRSTVLVVEDERLDRESLVSLLAENHYQVLDTASGREAISIAASRRPDLLLLNLGLPDIDGMDVLRSIRCWSNIPVVVVSARDQEQDKVDALDAGANDYVTKPFGAAELLARIRAALRQPARSLSSTHRIGHLLIDNDKMRVTLEGREIYLTRIEYKILRLLAKNAGRALTYDTIIHEVWGGAAAADIQTLRVNMGNIRRKIEANPADPVYLITEVGVGYRLTPGV